MKIIGFAGSLRSGSYNKMALHIALASAQEAGAEIDEVDLKSLDIPLYDGDLENEVKVPEGVQKLRDKIAAADGLMMAIPEYNHSISGVAKNTIDWLSRTKYAPDILDQKPTAILGASDGYFGTVRAQVAFFPIANTLGLNLMYANTYVTNSDEKFDDKGNCTDEKTKERLEKLGKDFVAFVEKNS